MDIEQSEFGITWANSPAGKAFIQERERKALSKERERQLQIKKEKWLRISTPFRAIGKFFSSM